MSKIVDVTDDPTGNWGSVISSSSVSDPDDAVRSRGLDVQVRNPSLPMGYSTNPYSVGGAVATALGIALSNPQIRSGLSTAAKDIGTGVLTLAGTGYDKAKDWIVTKWSGANKTTKTYPTSITSRVPLPTIGPSYTSPPTSHMAMIPYTASSSALISQPSRAISKASSDALAPVMTGYDIVGEGVKGYHPIADTYYGRRQRLGRGGGNVNSLAFEGFGGSGQRDPAIARAIAQARVRR